MNEIGQLRSLADIGEKRLVGLILERLALPAIIVGGRGNDATALDIGLEGSVLLVTTDRCPTPLAYKMDSSNVGIWGDLAITCVASDLLASGGRPTAFLVTLLLPQDLSGTDVLRLMRRAEALANSLGAAIVAGDTKESSRLEVVTTGLALAPRHRLVRRCGARAGDLLVLTGQVGAFTAAHLAWKRGVAQADLASELLIPVLEPRPAYEAATTLLLELEPKAGMDLSDGLLSTVFTLADLNCLGITIKESSLPISQAAVEVAHRFSVPPLRLAFGTGDWQIAYAVDPDQWRELPPTSRAHRQLYPIGEFTSDAGVRLYGNDGRFRELCRIEQQHFAATSADRSFLDHLLQTSIFVESPQVC